MKEYLNAEVINSTPPTKEKIEHLVEMFNSAMEGMYVLLSRDIGEVYEKDIPKEGPVREMLDEAEARDVIKIVKEEETPCDQDCVIDGILAKAKGIDVVKEEIDNMKREHRDVSGAIRNLKIKLAVLQANINRREESLDLAITEFEKIKINTGEEEPLEYKEAELESLKRTKSELLFAMTSLVYKNNMEFNKRLDILNDKIEKLEQDIENEQ